METELFKNLQEEFQLFAKIFTGKIAELRQKTRENELEASDIRAAHKLNRFQKQDEINSFRNELVTRNKERLFNEIRKIKNENSESIVSLEKRLSELILRERHLTDETTEVRNERVRLENMHLKQPEKLNDVILMKKSQEMEVEIANEEEQMELAKMATELRKLETKRLKAEGEFHERFGKSQDNQPHLPQFVNKGNEERFRGTVSLLNSEIMESRHHQSKWTPIIGDEEGKINYLLQKEHQLKLENQELTLKMQLCLQELEKRKAEFEKVMQQMAKDFSAKKQRPQNANVGSVATTHRDDKRKLAAQTQQRHLQTLTDHLFKLEFVKKVQNQQSLSELWQENSVKIDQLTRLNPHLMSPKPSSRANIILGSEMFEDFELKTSIDGSSRKNGPLRTFKSQSPGKIARMCLPSNFTPSKFGSLDDAQSFQFDNNSEFTEKQFSNKKPTPTNVRVMRLH